MMPGRTHLPVLFVLSVMLIIPVGLAEAQRPDKHTIKTSGDAVTLSDQEQAPADIPVTDPDTLRAIHASYVEDNQYQLERPVAEPLPPPKLRKPRPKWLTSIGRFFASIFTALGPVLRVLLIIGVAGLVALLAWFLLDGASRFGFRRSATRKTDDSDDVLADMRPDQTAARSLLDEADALARKGQFAEAVHLLLFRSIEDIQTRQSGVVSHDLTAREIGRLSILPDKPRQALAPIIALVEESFFGGRTVDRSGWETARHSYEAFAFGEAWS